MEIKPADTANVTQVCFNVIKVRSCMLMAKDALRSRSRRGEDTSSKVHGAFCVG